MALLGLCWDSGQPSVIKPGVTLRSSLLMFISQSLNDYMIAYGFISFCLRSDAGVESSLSSVRHRRSLVSHPPVGSLAGWWGAYEPDGSEANRVWCEWSVHQPPLQINAESRLLVSAGESWPGWCVSICLWDICPSFPDSQDVFSR